MLPTMSRRHESSRPSLARTGPLTTHLFVILLFTLLTGVMTWPLVLNLRDAVPGPPWDNFVWLYDLWWFRTSIVELGEWPAFNGTVFHPFGYDLRLSETMLANKALIAPILFWGDEVLAYNTLLLLGFILTGYTTYLLISYLTDSPHAGVLAGAILAYCPFRMHAMAAGWLPLLSTQWIPLVFLNLERSLRERKVGFALAAGLFVALTLLSSWYYLYILGGMVVVYLFARLYPWRESLRQGWVWRNLLLAAVVALALVAPVAWPIVAERSGEMGWSLSEVEKWAASVEDFVLPNIYHPVWGARTLQTRANTLRYPWYAPGFVYLGVVALLLCIPAASALATRPSQGSATVRALAGMGVVSLVLALGVVLRWNGQVVTVRVPEAVERFFVRGMSTLMGKLALHKASYYEIGGPGATVGGDGHAIPIVLPAMLVYLFMPLGNAMRTLYRFGFMTMFAVSTLAGLGAAKLLGYPAGSTEPDVWTASDSQGQVSSTTPVAGPRRGWVRTLLRLFVTLILLLLVIGDFICVPLAYGFSDVKPQPLDRWLSARATDAVVMQFPVIRAMSGDSLYRTKYHGKRVAYGHGTFYPAEVLEAMPTLATFPSEECLATLRSWGVTHVVVGSGAYDAGWGDRAGQSWKSLERELSAAPGLSLAAVAVDEPIWRDEWVSAIISAPAASTLAGEPMSPAGQRVGGPPVEPILVDKTFIYKLR